MSGTGVKEVYIAKTVSGTGNKKSMVYPVSRKTTPISKKMRGIISIADPAIIEDIAESDLL